MYKVDYHVHTNFSADSNEDITKVIEKAISMKLDEIAITEHLEIKTGLSENYTLDLDSYYKEVEELKKKYKKKLKIIFGVEIGFSRESQDEINKLIKKYEFDFIISSVHSIGKENFLTNDFFVGKSQKESYTEYFNEVLKAVKEFKNYDVLGHIDFICRYGEYDTKNLNYEDYKEIIDEILLTITKDKKGIEVNTSGLRYGRDSFYPNETILKRYKELGGKRITIGSDAHKKEDIFYQVEEVIKLLKDIGFKSYSTFKNRKEKQIML